MSDSLYDQDFVTWTEHQAEALRRAARQGSNLPIDWEHVAEEIADLGSEVLRQIESLTHQVLTQVLKLACSDRVDLARKWKAEVDEFRYQLERKLRDNHAIRAKYGDVVQAEWDRALRTARRSFIRYEESAALQRLELWRSRGVTPDEVLADGLYPLAGTTVMESEDA